MANRTLKSIFYTKSLEYHSPAHTNAFLTQCNVNKYGQLCTPQ